MAKRRTTPKQSAPRIPQVPSVAQAQATPYFAVSEPRLVPGGTEVADGPGSFDPQTGLQWPSATETGDPGRFSDFPQFGQVARTGLLSYGSGYMPMGETGASRVFNPDTISIAEYDMMGLDPTIRAGLLGYALIMQTADLAVSCPDSDMKALIEAEFLPLLPRLMRETVGPALRFGWADAEIVWENKYNVAVEVDRPPPPPPDPAPIPAGMGVPVPPGGDGVPGVGGAGPLPAVAPSDASAMPPPGGMAPGGPAMPAASPDPSGSGVASDGPVGAAPPPPSPGDVKNYRVYPYVTTVKDFVPIPNPSVVLRQTPGGELAGAVQYAYKQTFIPPSKLFHYATDSLFRNPYGMAMTKPCYPFFYWTRFLYEMLMVCVERAGAPPVIGRYPANARLTVGTTINGSPITEDAGTVMKQKLQNLRSFAVATFPRVFDEHGNDMYSIEELPLDAHVDWITDAIDLLNREKMKAMFFPDKILESGEVGSYALAKEHTDVFSLAVQARLDEFLDGINRGVLKQFVRFNDRKCPPAKITYSQPNVEAMQGLMMAVVQAITTGTALVTQTQDQVLVPNWRKLADDLGIPYTIVRKTDGMDAMGNPLQPGMDPDAQDAQAAQSAQGGPRGKAAPPPGQQPAPAQGQPSLPPDQMQPGAGAFPQPGQVQMRQDGGAGDPPAPLTELALWEDPAPHADRALGPVMLDAVKKKYGTVPVAQASGQHILFPDGSLSGNCLTHSHAASTAMAAAGHPEVTGMRATPPFLQATGAARIHTTHGGFAVNSHHPMTPAMLKAVGMIHAAHGPKEFSFSVGNDDMDPDQPHTTDVEKIGRVNALATAKREGMATSGKTQLREDAAQPPAPAIPADDGHAQPGVTTNATEWDKGGLKSITGHDNVHSLHRHLFGGMAGRIEGHYHIDYDPPPGFSPLRFEGAVLNDKGTNAIGDIARDFHGGIPDRDGNPQAKRMENSYLNLSASHQGKGIAARLYDSQEQYARATGVQSIHVHADISTGPYAWAKQGFDFSPDQTSAVSSEDQEHRLAASPLEHYKNALNKAVTTQGEDGDLNERQVGAHLAAVEGLKHSWDVANFDTGVHVPLASLDGKPGPLGKYVMTQKPYRLDYMGHKDITPDASSAGERVAAATRAAHAQAADATQGDGQAFHPDAFENPRMAKAALSEVGLAESGRYWQPHTDAIAEKLKGNPDFQKMAADIQGGKTGWYNMPTPDRAGDPRMAIYNTTEALSRHWGVQGGAYHPHSVLMQRAIHEEFGAGQANLTHVAPAISGAADQLAAANPHWHPALKAWARAQYQHTQDYYGQEGRNDVQLSRGVTIDHHALKRGEYDKVLPKPMAKAMKADQEYSGVVPMKLQPASSFSEDTETPEAFHYPEDSHSHGVIMGASVPIQRILGSHETGLGERYQQEHVVLGGEHKAFVHAGRMGDENDAAAHLQYP